MQSIMPVRSGRTSTSKSKPGAKSQGRDPVAAASAAFDRWLDRELHTLGKAMAEPAPSHLVAAIRGHSKVTGKGD